MKMRRSRIIGTAAIVVMAGLLLAAIFQIEYGTPIPVQETCSIGVSGTAANVTFTGIAADQACSNVVTQSPSAGLQFYQFTSQPSGTEICEGDFSPSGSGTGASLHYVVRDTGLFNLVGASLCAFFGGLRDPHWATLTPQAQATQSEATQVVSTEATQTAIAYGEQQAVNDANSQLGSALGSLRNDTSTLSSFSEANTLSSYARDWQTMQKDYTTEQKDAQTGCGDGNYNYGTVQYDAGTVDYDRGSIQYDDGSLTYDKNTYNGELSAVQSDIQSVNNAWSRLQQAVANNTTDMPAPQYTASDVNDALQNAQNAEKEAQRVWQSAQESATQYDQQASALKRKADALPASMHCT